MTPLQAERLLIIVQEAKQNGWYMGTSAELAKLFGGDGISVTPRAANYFITHLAGAYGCCSKQGRRWRVDHENLCTEPESAAYLMELQRLCQSGANRAYRVSREEFCQVLETRYGADRETMDDFFEVALGGDYVEALVNPRGYIRPGPRMMQQLEYLELLSRSVASNE